MAGSAPATLAQRVIVGHRDYLASVADAGFEPRDLAYVGDILRRQLRNWQDSIAVASEWRVAA